ncbi:MAG: hypothetical protein PHC53_01485 [Patescibacteria group bacterium]|nr:hypothetical protein [Patescibacteria group bacterium]
MDKFINQIIDQQQRDGSFLDSTGSPSILYTSLVLSCLNRYKDAPLAAEVERAGGELRDIKEKAANFLLSQKNEDGMLGDDMGVNYYALGTLAEFDKDIIDGADLAKILTGLIALESQEGGPYYSSSIADKIIDPVTNACIARFLSFYEVELPNLGQFCGLLDTSGKAIDAFRLMFTPALSAAVSLEDLFFTLKSNEREMRQGDQDMSFNASEQRVIDKIMEAAERRFRGLSGEFLTLATQKIQKTIKGNRDKQMSLMAAYMRQALGKKANTISDETVAQMGLANIFFWTAFIIYDDFWDEDEAADPRILPTANLYARHYVDYFGSLLPESTGFRAFFHSLMDKLDEANTWETMHCRTEVKGSKFIIPDYLPEYGDYEFKYRPASGHILGPVAMLVQLGCGLNSQEVKNLIAYFKNYLIAMQINDDSHDWEEDLRRGHISTVVALLLKDLNWPKKEIDLETDLVELKKVFWFETITKAAHLAVMHTERSRQALGALTILDDKAPLERFITITENVAKKALKEQKESLNFLQAYRKLSV